MGTTVEAADLLRVLSHPVRLEIVRLTSREELPVGALADRLDLSQPLTSQHLRILRDHGIVAARRDGNRRLYRADAERADELRAFLDDLWATDLRRLKAAAERRHRGHR